MSYVVIVQNRHIESCGEPPELEAGGSNCYTGYYESQSGDQLVFQYNRSVERGFLWLGDYSWEKPQRVIGGEVTLILGQDEKAWLESVWKVATKER